MSTADRSTPFERPVVLVSWNGHGEPLKYFHLDAAAEFELLLFDYTGTQAGGRRVIAGVEAEVLSAVTECKGDIYQALCGWLHEQGRQPEFVGLIDDDVWLSASGVNRALHLARCEGFDVFSPTLLHDSFATHRWMLCQPHRLFREVDWVEVMMPFYRGDLFLSAREHLAGNISSWGLDKYLWPTLQQIRGQTRTVLIDAVTASHRRPISSGGKVYRHGLNAKQELAKMRELAIALLHAHRGDLIHSAWYRRVFVQRHVRSRWQQLLFGLGRPIRRWLDQST